MGYLTPRMSSNVRSKVVVHTVWGPGRPNCLYVVWWRYVNAHHCNVIGRGWKGRWLIPGRSLVVTWQARQRRTNNRSSWPWRQTACWKGSFLTTPSCRWDGGFDCPAKYDLPASSCWPDVENRGWILRPLLVVVEAHKCAAERQRCCRHVQPHAPPQLATRVLAEGLVVLVVFYQDSDDRHWQNTCNIIYIFLEDANKQI